MQCDPIRVVLPADHLAYVELLADSGGFNLSDQSPFGAV